MTRKLSRFTADGRRRNERKRIPTDFSDKTAAQRDPKKSTNKRKRKLTATSNWGSEKVKEKVAEIERVQMPKRALKGRSFFRVQKSGVPSKEGGFTNYRVQISGQ